MDFAAWQSLHQSDPAAAADLFRTRRRAFTAAQDRAIWASLSDEAVWTAEPPANAPLRGLPFAIKDLFHLAGHATAGSGKLPVRRARRDGTLVARLRELGAIPVGKTHLHEFAYGLTGENPHFGNVDHPYHPGHDAGGSSSGSAAAVAAGLVPFALGTDTGGSLRVPAAFCGLYSWRETPGHPWIADAFPLAPSFDTAGWLVRSPADLRRLHVALRGAFPQPPCRPRGAWAPPSLFEVECPPAATAALSAAAASLTTRTLTAEDPLCRTFAGSNQAYSILQSTEAYGIHHDTLDRRRADYGEAVWQRIDRGRRWTAAEVDQARLHLLKVRLAFTRFFADHDFLVMPVSTLPAPTAEQRNQALRDTLLNLTTPVSLAGLPALTTPVPFENDFTLGLQVVFPSVHSAALDWVLGRCESC